MPKKILRKKEKGLNRHWKNFIDKNYLGSHNLEEGEEMLLTIERFEGEEEVQGADGGKSLKMVLYFKEEVPKMILNITNSTTIASLYGSHPEQWYNKKILVYAASVKAFGKQQEALRIRDFIPKIEINKEEFATKLHPAQNLAELKVIWASLPTSARNDKDLIALKDALKEKLA